MSKVYAFMADGSEEVELLSVVNVLLRGGHDVKLVSVTGRKEIDSAHHIKIRADYELSEIDVSDGDVLFLPGGMPGTRNLGEDEGLCKALLKAYEDGKQLAAICAAPSIFGKLGLLEGKKATCFPGFEQELTGAEYTHQGVITDGRITTARGLGYGLDLGLELLRILAGEEKSQEIKQEIQYDQI